MPKTRTAFLDSLDESDAQNAPCRSLVIKRRGAYHRKNSVVSGKFRAVKNLMLKTGDLKSLHNQLLINPSLQRRKRAHQAMNQQPRRHRYRRLPVCFSSSGHIGFVDVEIG
jgi:hypothetical protein